MEAGRVGPCALAATPSIPMNASFLLVALVVFGIFVLLLVALAIAAASATKGHEDGKRGCFGGCGLAAVLLFLCLLGIAGFVALFAVSTGVAAVDHNPVRSVSGVWDKEREVVVLTFEVEGSAKFVLDVIEHRLDLTDEDVRLRRRTEGPPDNPINLIDIEIPVDPHDIEELKEELRDFPGLSERLGRPLPDGVRVIFRDAERPR